MSGVRQETSEEWLFRALPQTPFTEAMLRLLEMGDGHFPTELPSGWGSSKKPPKLNSNQTRFLENCLICDNITEAYLNSGYKCSRASAHAASARLLTTLLSRDSHPLVRKVLAAQARTRKRSQDAMGIFNDAATQLTERLNGNDRKTA